MLECDRQARAEFDCPLAEQAESIHASFNDGKLTCSPVNLVANGKVLFPNKKCRTELVLRGGAHPLP